MISKPMRFRKKPLAIEAIQWDGKDPDKIFSFMKATAIGTRLFLDDSIGIVTLKGTMHASPGDWIIKGINGEFYPCKPDIFAKSYERTNE